MGQAPEKILDPVASPAAAKVVQECINIQMRYWRCLHTAGSLSPTPLMDVVKILLIELVRGFRER